MGLYVVTMKSTIASKVSLHKRIRIKMILLGITGGKIAKKARTTRQAVNMTIAGNRKNPRLRAIIAKELGIPYSQLWGKEGK